MITTLFAAALVALTPLDLDQCARTVYGEARGLPQRDQAVIVHIIANRLQHGWGSSVRAVVRAPAQFSAWNAGDPNRPIMLRAHARTLRRYTMTCFYVLHGHIEGWLEDTSKGANHYWHGDNVPYWAVGKRWWRVGHTYMLATR